MNFINSGKHFFQIIKIVGFLPFHIDRNYVKSTSRDLIYIVIFNGSLLMCVLVSINREYIGVQEKISINTETIASHIQALVSIYLYFFIVFEWICQRQNHVRLLNGITDFDAQLYRVLRTTVNNRHYARVAVLKYAAVIGLATVFHVVSGWVFAWSVLELNVFQQLFEVITSIMMFSLYVCAFYIMICANWLNRRWTIVHSELERILWRLESVQINPFYSILDLLEALWQLKSIFSDVFGKWLLYMNSYDMFLMAVASYRFLLATFNGSTRTEPEKFVVYAMFCLPHVGRNLLFVHEINQLYIQVICCSGLSIITLLME